MRPSSPRRPRDGQQGTGAGASDAASVLDLSDLVDETVDVPEWGVRLRVRSLTGSERDAFEASLLENRGKSREVNLRNMRAKLVAASVRKTDDSRVFSDGQVEALGRKNAAALQRVFRVAQRPAWPRTRSRS